MLYPGVEVLRMDADTVSATNTHEKLFQRFESEQIPILLGTQMVTKGLNFENVTLVGVLDADLSLYAEEFPGGRDDLFPAGPGHRPRGPRQTGRPGGDPDHDTRSTRC